MRYQAVIFDVGDTLLSSQPSQEQIYADRLRFLGFAVDDAMLPAIADALAHAAHTQIAREEKGAPRMSDEDFDRMLDKAALACCPRTESDSFYVEKLSTRPLPEQKLTIIPGTRETLERLVEKGVRMGIVSNHRAWLPDYLAAIGFSAYFETIVVSDLVGVEKPDVRIMQIALENLSLPASSCLYVGDHPFDVLCAKKAGLDCAWLAPADAVLPDSVPYRADYRVQKLADLLAFVE